jgi:hypothetical protein
MVMCYMLCFNGTLSKGFGCFVWRLHSASVPGDGLFTSVLLSRCPCLGGMKTAGDEGLRKGYEDSGGQQRSKGTAVGWYVGMASRVKGPGGCLEVEQWEVE